MSAGEVGVLRALAEGATPGPWAHSTVLRGHVYSNEGDVLVGRPRDAEYVAAIRPDVLLRLLDRLERAEAAVERVRALRADWRSLPVWGPDEHGLHILDGVDVEGIWKDLDQALDGVQEPQKRHVRPPRASERTRGGQPCGPCRLEDHHVCAGTLAHPCPCCDLTAADPEEAK